MGTRKRQKKSVFGIIVSLIIFAIMSGPLAAEEVKRSESDIARQLQNPLVNLDLLNLASPGMSSPNLDRFYLNQSGLTPVKRILPFSLSPGSGIISQSIWPVQTKKRIMDSFGVRDLSVSALVAPADIPTIAWGLGPALSFPTAVGNATGAKWGTGASGAVVYSVKALVGGVFISNTWSFEGNSRQDSNQMVVQPFLSYNLSKGWYLASAPAISVNWQASSSNAWTVPIGGGVGKVVSVYGQMLNVAAQGYVYPVHPVPGPGWAVQTTLQWLFPK